MRTVGLIALAAAVFVGSCAPRDDRTEIQVQRIFGECGAEIGSRTDAQNLDSECGVITALLNAFEAENPDVHVRVNIAPWPGYDQLSARLAAGDPPDLVTMHVSSIPDYQSRGLLEPMGAGLRDVGVDPAIFTPTARAGVSRHGEIYGLPIDIWAPLWHINMNEFRKAGLVRSDGSPILPTSASELLAQARQFTRATGKPYFVQSMANERAAYARNLYSLLMQQNAVMFPDRRRIDLTTPQAHAVVQLFKDIYDQGLTTRNQDYSAATAGFINGQGGVYLVGTWMIGDFEREAHRAGAALENGYAVVPYPQLYPGRPASFIDGHAWVMPTRDRTPKEREAVFRLLRFFARHDLDWSRTGHLPTVAAVIDSPEYLALPHRATVASLAEIGHPLPPDVQRQFAIQDIIGDEMASAITGRKPIDRALADAEHRTNDLLFHIR